MNYQGYVPREDLLALVERDFPPVERPKNDDLFAVGKNDLMRRILSKEIENSEGGQASYDDVIALYDESASLTSEGMKWLLPSILRFVLREKDSSGNLPSSIVCYLENSDYFDKNRFLNFSWLTAQQLKTLDMILEYLSEQHGEIIAGARENLAKYQGT